jgi:hypothetical protein
VNEGDLWAWWEERAKRPQERAAWLTAWFVESSGLFEIRVDESERCSGCGGTGVLRTMNADGTTSSLGCPTCRGAAKVRVLEFR